MAGYYVAGKRAGAVAGMIGGFATAVLWVVMLKARVYELYEMIPGFLVSLTLTIGVSLFTDPPEVAADEFESVRQAQSREPKPVTRPQPGGR